MTLSMIGDGARQFQLSRQNTSLKSDLNRLTSELSSGQVSDRSNAVNGRTARLGGIEHSLIILAGYQDTTRETGQLLETVQHVLAAIDNKREALAGDLLLVNHNSPAFQIDEAGRNAAADFSDIVNKLNTRSGERSLFSGAAVDRPALAAPEVILTELLTTIGSETNAVEIISRVEGWFDDPGGFVAVGYLGDEGSAISRDLSATDTVSLDARADNDEIRDLLKAHAIAALADRAGGLEKSTKASLLEYAGLALQSAATPLTQLQTRVGFAEADVTRVTVSQSAEITMLSEAKNAYVAADPFEVATKLQALQIQLETHYAMIARLSRLNLSSYL